MQRETLFSQYEKIVLNNKERFLKEYKNVSTAVENSTAKYKGKPVEFLYQPMFLKREDMERFEYLISRLMEILNKVIQRYIEDQVFRSHFGFPELLEQLILKDPGYGINVPMGRFDIFYHPNGGFQFCELNADGSSGMNEVRELQEIIGKSLALEVFQEEYRYNGFELFDSWVDSLVKNYREFSRSDKKPNVAIVDWFSGSIPSEFIVFRETFEQRGYAAIIAEPKDLTYRDGKLYCGDFPIDCIYRRVVTWEIIERAQEAQDLIKAYLDGAVCVVGPIRSQIIHNKMVFAILHDEEKTPFLTAEDRAYIRQHIPYTTLFSLKDKDLVEWAIKDKDRFVLKPTDRYASYGVYVGRDFDEEQWKSIIKEKVQEDYLLQEFCQVPQIPMAYFNEQDVQFIETNYLMGIFVYNEKIQGIYTRTGRCSIIGSVVECFTVPNFVMEPLKESDNRQQNCER